MKVCQTDCVEWSLSYSILSCDESVSAHVGAQIVNTSKEINHNILDTRVS
jgi:hypothetical protein